MTAIVPGSPADQAADWLARRAGGADIASDPVFTAWLKADPSHELAWSEAERLWASFPAEPDMLLAAMRQVALEARPRSANDDASHVEERSDAERPAPFRKVAVWLSIAAALLLMVGIGWQQGLFPAPGSSPSIAIARYASPVGQRRTVQLADASVVTLDSGSAITVRLSDTRRDVTLEHGQAYFAVTHDRTRPFAVAAAGGTVTDIGTEFAVLAKADGMRVIVIKGSVAVADPAGSTRLVAGEGFDTSPATRGRLPSPDTNALLAWRTGYLEFRDTSLAAAIAEMNRYATHPIVLADPRAGSLPVSGRFTAGDSEKFARSIATLYGLRVSHDVRGRIVLTGRGH